MCVCVCVCQSVRLLVLSDQLFDQTASYLSSNRTFVISLFKSIYLSIYLGAFKHT